MFSHLSNNYKGIILAVIGFACFSVSDACAKVLTADYAVFEIIAIVSCMSVSILTILSPKLGGFKKTFKTQKMTIHLLRGLSNTIISVLIVLSFSKLALAPVYTLLFVAPFITTILSIPIFKEKVDWHGWVAIIIGFCGVLVVLRPGFADINPWLLLPLLTAFGVAALFLLSRALGENETLLSLALFPALSNLLLLGPFVAPSFTMPEINHLPIFLLSSSTVVIGLMCTATAFRIAKASIVGPFQYTQMIWALLLGYFIFGDGADIWTLLGGAIIISSGIYLIERERNFSQ